MVLLTGLGRLDHPDGATASSRMNTNEWGHTVPPTFHSLLLLLLALSKRGEGQ